jgi:hypothetical protein
MVIVDRRRSNSILHISWFRLIVDLPRVVPTIVWILQFCTCTMSHGSSVSLHEETLIRSAKTPLRIGRLDDADAACFAHFSQLGIMAEQSKRFSLHMRWHSVANNILTTARWRLMRDRPSPYVSIFLQRLQSMYTKQIASQMQMTKNIACVYHCLVHRDQCS